VTNQLLRLCEQALGRGAWHAAHEQLAEQHRDLLEELGLDPALLDALLEELHGLLRGIELIGEATPRTQDLVASFGERLSARLVAAHLAQQGLDARALDAWDAGLVTDARFGAARPLPESAARIQGRLQGFEGLPVITGYIGQDAQGRVTTLGRGGSDYSAAIFGAALRAREIQIWTDVDGVMSADPRIVPGARQRERLSFAEAAELAFFGAKVLHPATMVPAIEQGIPIRVLNSFRPEFPGTTVVATLAPHERGVKSIASKHGIAVVNVVAAPMLLQFGFLERVADVFARHEVVVDVIATSEVSLALTTEAGARLEPVVAELSKFSEARVLRDMALVSVVGEELRDSPRVHALVLATLAELGVKVEMLSYGATRNNLSVVLPETRLNETVVALHERLFDRA
jgi:aspartate kinase